MVTHLTALGCPVSGFRHSWMWGKHIEEKIPLLTELWPPDDFLILPWDDWLLPFHPWESENQWLTCCNHDEKLDLLMMQGTGLEVDWVRTVGDSACADWASANDIYANGLWELTGRELKFGRCLLIDKVPRCSRVSECWKYKYRLWVPYLNRKHETTGDKSNRVICGCGICIGLIETVSLGRAAWMRLAGCFHNRLSRWIRCWLLACKTARRCPWNTLSSHSLASPSSGACLKTLWNSF